MDTSVPVPRPRPSPLPRLTALDGNMKKPIPKPRRRMLKDLDSDSACADDVTGVGEDGKSDAEDTEGVQGKAASSRVKKEPTFTSENVNKGRFAFDGTRTVSARLEKSVKNIARRLTVRPPSPNREDVFTSSKLARSQSLPSEDIFQSISFNSPLVSESESRETLVERLEVAEEEKEEEEEVEIYSSAPPPVYPPPPLPDESVYDEVQSVISNHSSHYSDSIRSMSVLKPKSESVYDDVTIVDRRGGRPRPRIISQMYSSDMKSDAADSLIRSESWTYQEIGPSDSGDVIDTSSDYYVYSKDSSSYVSGRTQSCSSVLSELDALGYTSGEDMFDDEQSSSSPARSSTSQSVSIYNELFDNGEPKPVRNISPVAIRQSEGRKLPSKSVILEFDPLFDNTLQESGLHSKSENLLLCLTNNKEVKPVKCSPYGKISKPVKQPTVDELSEKEDLYGPPPIPPRRIDSIALSAVEEQLVSPHVECTKDLVIPPRKVVHIYNADIVEYHPSQDEMDDFIPESSSSRTASSDGSQEDSPSKRRNLVRWTSMKRAMKFVADSTRPMRSPSMIRRNGRSDPRDQQPGSGTSPVAGERDVIVERPIISDQTLLSRSGIVYKMAINKERTQDHVRRWCVLAEGKITFYADQTGAVIRETISLSSILSVHVVLDQKLSADGDCFEINTACKSRYVYGTAGTSERRVWMQKILESMTNAFPLRIVSEYTRAGWCFLKEGISGMWSAAWILIHMRLLYYSIEKTGIQEIDLRKARCVVLQDADKDVQFLKVSEKGPIILLDCQGQALYLRMDTNRETASWQKEIRAAAVDNGPNLAQQQLTKDDIPCIVDKCIKFVYAHGSMSEGIYRKNGTNSSVTRLLELFRLDAFAVQLSRQEYSEYDVSSVLKRFFRDLPEPLLTTELHGPFCDIAAGKCGKDRVAVYRRTLERLPPINYLTARKLIGHLHFIHEQQEKNRMPVENLAAIWGPTLMHIEMTAASESYEQSKLETATVADLILLHPQLFEVDAEERNREKRMQEVLERYHASNNTPQNKPSGELHVWVYLESRDSGNCVNITIGPHKSAGEVCTELANKTKYAAHELGLEEVICGGSLVRMLHYTEKVLETVLRWGYWDDADRKDNALVLKRNNLYREVLPLAKPPLAMCAELRFADSSTKSFKTFLFEFSQARLCYYKDKRGSIKVQEWNVEDIIWYLGFEPKRNPQARWSITFIPKHKQSSRTKEKPYFGCTIAGSTKDEQLRWMAALLIGEYPQGLMMSPVLLP
ncbi:arf-GAP with Rho-GAP domain, ANK repeat and PH domain-containing protein 1 [Anabrus simplex]|uniref:arf-GAP with Rho-GAP domain, ANK repeat and PH domain-containing protein 1 n=1 Tax=Anabrus simplex TaxID=316456 RepID=UPI0035A2838E